MITTLIAAAMLSCNPANAETSLPCEDFHNDGIITEVTCARSEGNSSDAEKTIPVAKFNALVLDGGYEVKYTIGEPSLRICASKNVIDNILASVSDGTLRIRHEKKYKAAMKVTLYISSWTLEDVELNGAVDFEADKGISSENFHLEMNGAGEVEIEGLKTGKCDITVNGAGNVDIEKIDCKLLKVQFNGAGKAELSGNADKADIELNGAGSIDVHDLKYKEINSSANGLGKIQR